MTLEVNYSTHNSNYPSEREFQKKMIERIKSNFDDVLDDEDIISLEQGEDEFKRIIKKYFCKP